MATTRSEEKATAVSSLKSIKNEVNEIGGSAFKGLLAALGTGIGAQVKAILAKYGTNAHVYLPHIGVLSGLTAGNYLDSAGTTAGTVDNPVGLVLDAAGSVGAELVTNGDFSNGLTGWVSNTNWSLVDGKATSDGTTTGQFYASSSMPALTAGKTYLVELDAIITSSSVGAVYIGNTAGGGISTSGHKRFIITAGNTQGILFSLNGGCICSIDNISVKEVTGVHASQPTTANKPTLRRGASLVKGDSSTFTDSVGAWARPTGGQWRQGSVAASGGKLNVINPPSVAIASAVWGSGKLTVTTTLPHGYQSGEYSNISGFTPAGYNGYYVLSVLNANTVEYVVADAGVVTVLGGLFTGGLAELAIATVAGQTYSLAVTAYQNCFMAVGSAPNQGSGGTLLGQTGISSGRTTKPFTATGSMSYVTLYGGQASNAIALFDDVTVKSGAEWNYHWQFGDVTDRLIGTGALPANADIFIGLLRTTASDLVSLSSAADGYLGVMASGVTSVTYSAGAGTPTYAINGVDVAGGVNTTRGQLHAAFPLNTMNVLEVRNANLSTWGTWYLGGYNSFALVGDVSVMFIIPAMTAAERTLVRQFCAQLSGVTL